MDALLAADVRMLLWINGHHAPWADGVLLGVSMLGELDAVWIVVGLGLQGDAREAGMPLDGRADDPERVAARAPFAPFVRAQRLTKRLGDPLP